MVRVPSPLGWQQQPSVTNHNHHTVVWHLVINGRQALNIYDRQLCCRFFCFFFGCLSLDPYAFFCAQHEAHANLRSALPLSQIWTSNMKRMICLYTSISLLNDCRRHSRKIDRANRAGHVCFVWIVRVAVNFFFRCGRMFVSTVESEAGERWSWSFFPHLIWFNWTYSRLEHIAYLICRMLLIIWFCVSLLIPWSYSATI